MKSRDKNSREADDLCRKMALGLNLLIQQESKKAMGGSQSHEHRRNRIKSKKTISKKISSKTKSREKKNSKILKRVQNNPKKEEKPKIFQNIGEKKENPRIFQNPSATGGKDEKQTFFKLSQKFRDSMENMKRSIVEQKAGESSVSERTKNLIISKIMGKERKSRVVGEILKKVGERKLGEGVKLEIRPNQVTGLEGVGGTEADVRDVFERLAGLEPPMVRNETAICKKKEDGSKKLVGNANVGNQNQKNEIIADKKELKNIGKAEKNQENKGKIKENKKREKESKSMSETIKELEMAQIITPKILGIPNDQRRIMIPADFLGISDEQIMRNRNKIRAELIEREKSKKDKKTLAKIEKIKKQLQKKNEQSKTKDKKIDQNLKKSDFEEIEREYQKFKEREALKIEKERKKNPISAAQKEKDLKSIKIKAENNQKERKLMKYDLEQNRKRKPQLEDKSEWKPENEIEWGFMKSDLKKFLDMEELLDPKTESLSQNFKNPEKEKIEKFRVNKFDNFPARILKNRAPGEEQERTTESEKDGSELEKLLKKRKIEKIFKRERESFAEYRSPLQEIEKTLDVSFLERIKGMGGGNMKLSLGSLGRAEGKNASHWDLSGFFDSNKDFFEQTERDFYAKVKAKKEKMEAEVSSESEKSQQIPEDLLKPDSESKKTNEKESDTNNSQESGPQIQLEQSDKMRFCGIPVEVKGAVPSLMKEAEGVKREKIDMASSGNGLRVSEISPEKKKEFKEFISKALEHLKLQTFSNNDNTIEDTMSYFKKKERGKGLGMSRNKGYVYTKRRPKQGIGAKNQWRKVFKTSESNQGIEATSSINKAKTDDNANKKKKNINDPKTHSHKESGVDEGKSNDNRVLERENRDHGEEKARALKPETDSGNKIRVIKLEKEEMEDFLKCSRKRDQGLREEEKNKDIFLVGMERFDLCRDIFWKMRKAKETQAELTKEIAKHLNKDVEREHDKEKAKSWKNEEIFDVSQDEMSENEKTEQLKRKEQERADNKIWEKFFEDINETYNELENVRFCWKERGIYNRKSQKKKEEYPYMMLKSDDFGSFDFQHRFYRKWLVSPAKRVGKSRCKSDCCCCKGNEWLRKVLEGNRYLGVYDVFDLLDLMNLKIKDYSGSARERVKETRSTEPQKKEGYISKEGYGSNDEMSVKSDDTIKSGEGYAGLLNFSSGSVRTDSVSGSCEKGHDDRMNHQVIDQVVDSLLWKKAQSHFLQNQEAGTEFQPEEHREETFKVKYNLHQYLRLWRPVYSSSRTKVFFQIKRRIEFGGDLSAGWADSNRKTRYVPIRRGESSKPRNFVLVRHINKRDKKVYTADKGLISAFANDWVPDRTKKIEKSKILVSIDSRGEFKISRDRLEELMPKFTAIRESFLRLRFYLTRDCVEFFQKHFDFMNFLLLETKMWKECLVCERLGDFAMFWREYESECCYISKCLQCINSLRYEDSGDIEEREGNTVRVEAFGKGLMEFVVGCFGRKFLEMGDGLGEVREKLMCDCLQEHLGFFEFLAKVYEVLSKNNISVGKG